MQTICELDDQGVWTGRTAEIEDTDGVPAGWLQADPPTPTAGEIAVAEAGAWRIQDEGSLPAPALPDQIPMWAIRMILGVDGVVDAIDDVVASLPDTLENRAVKQQLIGRVPAPNFVRSSPLVATMVEVLGPTLSAAAGRTIDWAYIDDVRARAVAAMTY